MVNSKGILFFCEKYGTNSMSKHRKLDVVVEQFAQLKSSWLCVGVSFSIFLLSVTVCFFICVCNLCVCFLYSLITVLNVLHLVRIKVLYVVWLAFNGVFNNIAP